MPILKIEVEFKSPQDFEEQRFKLVSIVEDAIDELVSEELNDDTIVVTWDTED